MENSAKDFVAEVQENVGDKLTTAYAGTAPLALCAALLAYLKEQRP